MAWNPGSDIRFWGGLWWVTLGGAGYSGTSGSLNCAPRCVGTCRAKTIGLDLHSEVVHLVLCGTVLYWGRGACAVLGECAMFLL